MTQRLASLTVKTYMHVHEHAWMDNDVHNHVHAARHHRHHTYAHAQTDARNYAQHDDLHTILNVHATTQ